MKYVSTILSLFLLGTTAIAQNALSFDGVDDFIQTSNSGVTGSNDRTFEAWINVSPSAPSSNLTILDYGTNAAGSRNTFVIDANLAPRYLSGGTNGNLPGASIGVIAGQWFHVAFVLDNGTGYTYVNGVQASTGNLSNVNTPSGNQDITIGQRVTGGSIPFAGSIDEVRIWNTARSASEIMANMNNELCTYPTSLVGYYKLNQGLAAGNNSGLTTVIGELGDSAVATNFAMLGPGSNWITGASINTVTPLDFGITVDTSNQIISSNDTSANIRYQWYDCNANAILAGDTNRTLLSRTGGDYAIILSNGVCTDTSACITVNFNSSNQPGETLNFDGTDDFIQTTFPGVLGDSNRTFEVWIKLSPTAPSSSLAIMDYGTNAVGSRNTLIVNGNRGITFISGGTNANLGTPANLIPSGQWTHVAFVLDNGTGYIYINGVQVATGNLTNVNTPSGNENLRIGQRVTGGSIPFAGEIDELRIWDIARTASDIMTDMNTEYCGPVSGLVAHYNMNNGISGGNNSSINKLINSVNSGDGSFVNFALAGPNSNFLAPGASVTQAIIDTSVTAVAITLTSNEMNADSYQWINCSSNTVMVGYSTMSFTAPFSGIFAVEINKNGCIDTSSCTIVAGVGIEKNDFSSSIYLAQNPVKNELTLLNTKELNLNLELRSISGKLIKRLNLVNQNRININIESEAPGVYILTITGEDRSALNYKIIKH